MKNKLFTTLLVILLALGITACAVNDPHVLSPEEAAAVAQTLTAMAPTALPSSTPAPSETPAPSPTATKADTSVGPYIFPEGVNSLTGLKVADPALLERRPVLIKVANFPAVGRPHAGLSYADIVWEYYIGEGSNRFMALYYGQDSAKIGPVRSGRLVDPELTRMYNGVLAFSGANPENVLPRINELLGQRYLTESNCPGLCRDDWTVIGVFGSSADITSVMDSRGQEISNPDLTGTLFDSEVPSGGRDAEKASLIFNYLNKGDWVYDRTSGKYLRWIENADNWDQMIPLVDRLTDEQLAFSNVIMVHAYYTEYTTVLHEIGIWDNTAGQKATIFRDGKAYDVTWKTTDTEKPMQFFDEDGNLFPLKPGNTWMALIGTSSTRVISDGDWTYTFQIP